MDCLKKFNYVIVKDDLRDRPDDRPEILAYSEKWSYDLYLLTGIDIPWVKDDLRDRPDDRQSMFDHFKSTLDKLQKNYVVLEGNQDGPFLRLNIGL